MENNSLKNTTDNNFTVLYPIPLGAVAFAPFIFLELVAAIVSNAILLALVILACVHKLNNKVNIYLFSFSVGGMIGVFNLFCLLILVIARCWVFGEVICSISWFAVLVYNIIFLAVYLVISWEKLRGVKDPFKRQSSNKLAYIYSSVMWVASIFFAALLGGWMFRYTPILSAENGNFICFSLSNDRARSRSNFALISSIVISFWIASTVVIVITISNFVRILLELRELKKFRLHYIQQSRTSTVIRINGRDKPLYRNGEERTAKSLTLVYFIHFSCIFISYGMFYIQVIRNFVLPVEEQDVPNFQIYFIVQLMVLLFPSMNPVFLILTNKRLRGHVRELYKCTLNPEVEASPAHQLAITSTNLNPSVDFHSPPERLGTKTRIFQNVRSMIVPFNP